MRIAGLIWLDDIVAKLAVKHGVDTEEVEELLQNRPRLRFVENGHRAGENVYAALGQTYAGRYLICYFVYKKDHSALVLSARDMTAAERKRYGKK